MTGKEQRATPDLPMDIFNIPSEIFNLPDMDVGEYFYGLLMAWCTNSKGIPLDQATQESTDAILAELKQLETDDSRLDVLEKIIKLAVAGKFEQAGKRLKKEIKEKSLLAYGRIKGARAQQEYAKETKRIVKQLHDELLGDPRKARWELPDRALEIEKLLGKKTDQGKPYRTQPNGKLYKASTIGKIIQGKG